MARQIGKEYVVTTTATNLTTILGSSQFISHCVFRAGAANSGTTYLGGADLTASANRLVYLAAGESFSVSLENVYISSDKLYVIGTANDILHIYGVS